MKEAIDDLSKDLASGMSRRDALKRFGIVAFGAAFAVFRPGRAAAGHANRNVLACIPFCSYLYGVGSKAAAACVKDAFVRRSGACFEFGPASNVCSRVHCPHDTFCMSANLNYNYTKGSTTCVPF